MPIVEENSGFMYLLSNSDPYFFLVEGVTIWVPNGGFGVGSLDQADMANLLLAGTIRASVGVSMKDDAFVDTTIMITETSLVSGTSTGVYGLNAILRITNLGTIQGEVYGIQADLGSALLLDNAGTVRSAHGTAILGGNDFDRIVNTGLIVGAVFLGDGDDLIDTSGGTIIGTVFGGLGDDIYILGAQPVEIIEYPGGGRDTVEAGHDYVLGEGFEDLVLRGMAREGEGNEQANTIIGNQRNNLLTGNGGEDYMVGNAGADTLYGGAGIDFLEGGAGADKLYGGSDTDYLSDGLGSNLILGEEGNDVITVGGGTSIVNGGTGDDHIQVTGGAGTSVTGGAGVDALNMYVATEAIQIDLTLDKITGGHGWVTVIATIDWAETGAGNDTVRGHGGNNGLIGNAGDDTLQGLAGNDLLMGGAGGDTLDGGDGIDTADYRGSFGAVTVNLAAATAAGGDAARDKLSGIESLIGSANNDRLTGTVGANTLDGDQGNDVLSGGGGADRLIGGLGNDTLTGGAAGDIFVFQNYDPAIEGGLGNDTVTDFENGSDKIAIIDPRVILFDDLSFSQAGGDTVITIGIDTIRLTGVSLSLIDASDFIF